MGWIIFDIDGVLIDVSESYDLAVKRTVEHFLQKYGVEQTVSLTSIREMRQKGIFPDDYKLSEILIMGLKEKSIDRLIKDMPSDADIEHMRGRFELSVSSSEIKNFFENIYLGNDKGESDGLWKREKALVPSDSLKKVSRDQDLGVITGRSKRELRLAEKILSFEFGSAVTREDFVKPDPKAIRTLTEGEDGVYLGDSLVDKKLVENYNERYDTDFEFIWIGKGLEDVDKAIEQLYLKK